MADPVTTTTKKAAWLPYLPSLRPKGHLQPFVVKCRNLGVRIAYFETGHGDRELTTQRPLSDIEYILDVELPS